MSVLSIDVTPWAPTTLSVETREVGILVAAEKLRREATFCKLRYILFRYPGFAVLDDMLDKHSLEETTLTSQYNGSILA